VREVRPDVVFGADLIAGFPTETEAMFEGTLALVEDCGLTYLHVFPYSERDGTPAAAMPPVPGDVRKARAARLRTAGDRALKAYLAAQVGRTAPVLIEKPGLGRTEGFALARLDDAGGVPGEIVPVSLMKSDAEALYGHIGP